MELVFWLVFFQTKHFLFDFLYQPPWMYENKGIYMHIGGIAHSGLHAFFSFLALVWFVPLEAAGLIAFCEFLAHYHIDWAKMNINAAFGWSASNSANFWRLLGLDQWLHQLTYIAMLVALVAFEGVKG